MAPLKVIKNNHMISSAYLVLKFTLIYLGEQKMKKIFIPLFFVFITLIIISCSDDSVTKVDDKSLTGLYKATTFIDPGSNDAGVDILANNGILTVQFVNNFTAFGQFVIPGNISSNYSPIDTNYSGNYTIKDDTVRFSNTIGVLDNPDVYFIINDATLETPDYQGRWALFKIILTKQ